MIRVLTSSGPEGLGEVRLFADSLKRHCPEAAIEWSIADVRSDHVLEELAYPAIDSIRFLDDGDQRQDPEWLFLHELPELVGAAVPRVALNLLEQDDCEILFYFEPRCVVFAALDELIAALADSSIVLIPRVLEPERSSLSVEENEIAALRRGVFNPSFFGVRNGSEGRAFLRWWSDRCRGFRPLGLRTGGPLRDRWLNLAPSFFPSLSILRSSCFGVTARNCRQRRLEGTFDEGFRVDGGQLVFAGLGSDGVGGDEMNPTFAGINKWWVRRSRFLSSGGNFEWRLSRYDNGEEIPVRHRRIYGDRRDLRQAFQNPYGRSSEGYGLVDWFRETGVLEYEGL